MISDHNLGALMGAPVTGPNDEKIGTVGQVFVDPDTGQPNWVTVHTGLFGRHESFVPVEHATWDHEVLHVPFEKDVVKDAPRIDTDQALSQEDELSLYRYYRVPTGDVDPSTGGSSRAGTVGEQKPGLDESDDRHNGTESRTTAGTEDLPETRDAGDTPKTGEQTSGRVRMRRYVIVEEEVPVDSDQGEPGTPGTPRDPRS